MARTGRRRGGRRRKDTRPDQPVPLAHVRFKSELQARPLPFAVPFKWSAGRDYVFDRWLGKRRNCTARRSGEDIYYKRCDLHAEWNGKTLGPHDTIDEPGVITLRRVPGVMRRSQPPEWEEAPARLRARDEDERIAEHIARSTRRFAQQCAIYDVYERGYALACRQHQWSTRRETCGPRAPSRKPVLRPLGASEASLCLS